MTMSGASVYYEVATARLKTQWDLIDTLNGRAVTALQAGSVALPVGVGLVGLLTTTPNVATATLAGIAIVAYVVLLLAVLATHRVGGWHLSPKIRELKSWAPHADELEAQEWVADNCVLAIDANQPLLDSKADCLNVALWALPVEALALVLAIASTFYGRTV